MTVDRVAEAFVDASRHLVGAVAADLPRGPDRLDWVSINRFVEGIGDDDPLYLDPLYGARSAHATMLAPPTFVLAVAVPASVAGLHGQRSGLLPLVSAMEITWDDHLRLSDRLEADLRVADVRLGLPWRDRPTAVVVTNSEYRRHGAVVARARGTVRLYPLRFGAERFLEREVHRYTPAEIESFVARLESEAPRRGGTPRYWEDVEVGDALPTLIKGPLTLSDLITWMVAEGKPVKLGNLLHRELVGAPGRAAANPATGWPFWELAQAREDVFGSEHIGFAGPCGRGAMRVALAGQLVTHWQGDDGFLRRLAVSLPAPFMYGDTLSLSGRVRDRFVDGCNRGVELEIVGANQLGERILDGVAVVYLPTPGHPVRLPVPKPDAGQESPG